MWLGKGLSLLLLFGRRLYGNGICFANVAFTDLHETLTHDVYQPQKIFGHLNYLF